MSTTHSIHEIPNTTISAPAPVPMHNPVVPDTNQAIQPPPPPPPKEYWPYNYNYDWKDPKLEALPPPPAPTTPSSVRGGAGVDGRGNGPEYDGPNDYWPSHYGRIRRAKSFLREYGGEFFGTMLLVLFGTAANCQYNLSVVPEIAGTLAGTWASLSMAWGAGIAFGTLLSGGHINPAVTLAMATWRGFPWRKVPGYMFCQLMGALCGAGIIYGNYKTAIDIKEGGVHIRTLETAGYFATIPLSYMTNFGCFMDEFIGTAVLLFGVCALLDKRNNLSPGMFCVGIFILFVGIVACLGMQTGFALNPARDLGPRMFMAMVGYGRLVFTYRHVYWLWGPVFATFTGAQLGVMLYDMFLYLDDDSIVNRIWKEPR